MNRRHFETLQPVCPLCRKCRQLDSPLRLGRIAKTAGAHILEGILVCASAACQCEFPIIDGIPILVAEIRTFLSNSILPILARTDLSADLESLLGDACGPGSVYDTQRAYLSSYAWDHYGDFDPQEKGEARPGGVLRLFEEGLALMKRPLDGPLLECGCAVGRITRQLARHGQGLALGVDLSFAMLRAASQCLREGTFRYPRRRVGLVYDQREFAVPCETPDLFERVDFWACDACALPFASGTFATAIGLNVLDSVAGPLDWLHQLARVLRGDGQALLTCPYDWSTAATIPEAWLGGHSQRGPDDGACEPVLRALLTPGAHPATVPGLHLVAECDHIPWQVRLHDRSLHHYSVHVALARATAK